MIPFRKSHRFIVEDLNEFGMHKQPLPCIEIYWNGVWFCPIDDLIFNSVKERDAELINMMDSYFTMKEVVEKILHQTWKYLKKEMKE